jgi:hypothetical protein
MLPALFCDFAKEGPVNAKLLAPPGQKAGALSIKAVRGPAMQHDELIHITAGVVFVLLIALILSRRKRDR